MTKCDTLLSDLNSVKSKIHTLEQAHNTRTQLTQQMPDIEDDIFKSIPDIKPTPPEKIQHQNPFSQRKQNQRTYYYHNKKTP